MISRLWQTLVAGMLLSVTVAAQQQGAVDAVGRPVESIRHDLGAMTRQGFAFGGVVTIEELRQGRLLKGERLDVTSGTAREAFAAHWGDDFAVRGSADVLSVVSRSSRHCASMINRPVAATHVAGPLFDAVNKLMVAEGIAVDLPGTRWGTPTPSVEAVDAVVVDVTIAPGTRMVDVLNSLVDASKVERFGWLVIERGNGEETRCQLSFMFNDSSIWTSYDISKGRTQE